MTRSDPVIRSERLVGTVSACSDVPRTAAVRWEAVILAVLWTATAGGLGAAETGDLDGDGRVTLADVVHVGLPAAVGSVEAFAAHPCWGDSWSESTGAAGAYIEWLRRCVAGSPPNWLTFETAEAPPRDPLPADPRIRVEVLSADAPGDSDDRVEIVLGVTALSAFDAFALLLDAGDGLLRVPPGRSPFGGPAQWYDPSWRANWIVLGGYEFLQQGGDLPVTVTPQACLATGGRLVVAYDLWNDFPVVDPGEYQIVVEARLPNGTRAGVRDLRVLPASEFLLDDGSAIPPEVSEPGALRVENDVTAGWDEGPPPLRFDVAERRVLGEVAFRLADADGNPPAPGEPIAVGRPGEEVRFRVQMRTEVPLNEIRWRVSWDPAALVCGSGNPAVLFTNPEDGKPYRPTRHPAGYDENHCWSYGGAEAMFRLAGVQNGPSDPNYRERPLEHFKPLGEWTDLVELRLIVGDSAAGGSEVPIRFAPFLMPGTDEPRYVRFVPFTPDFPCEEDTWRGQVGWRYAVRHEDAFVRVLGEDPPVPPPDLGMRIDLGDAFGAPGESVRVPISVSARVPPQEIVVALELDPEAVGPQALEVDMLLPFTDERTVTELTPAGSAFNYLCVDDDGDGVADRCESGEPVFAFFRDTAERHVLLHLGGSPAWIGSEPREIARLRLRIREDAPGMDTALRPVTILYRFSDGREQEFVSGGKLLDPEADPRLSPAEVSGGTIVFSGLGFLRGDADSSGKVEVTDAVSILNYLFRGGPEPPCDDAADANDDAVVNISDAIFLLGALFLGQGAIPEPYPACGRDATPDDLACAAPLACTPQ